MDANDFVQLVLLASGGEVKGKTKLQKLAYFLGVKAGCVDDLGYRAHFYGPFSQAVADATEKLRRRGLVEKTVSGTGQADRGGFETSRRDYRLTQKGEEIAEKKRKRNARSWNEMINAMEAIRDGGDPGYMQLSIAAKTYYMLGEKGGRSTTDELSELADRFGWSVSVEQVSRAAEFLRKIGLVAQ